MAIGRLLITGAAGNLGRVLRARLAGAFPRLRLSDIAEMAPAGAGEEVVRCDLGDGEATAALCREVDAIVHLGGRSTEAPWPEIQRTNICGAVNLWEAARLAGVRRIIFASSNHVVGLYRRSQSLDHRVQPRPDSRYGLAKAFGEDLAALYALKHGISALCIRIGTCVPRPSNARMLSTWLSHGDFEQLIRIGLTADYRFEIVYGISRNRRAWWDNSNAYRLGYAPQDDAEAYAAELAGRTNADPLAERFQGGDFVPPDFTGDPELA
jgi:uronate dehydrogenase